MPAPSYLPEAVPTTIGWAHPLTGEQLDCTTGLADPVDFYIPNAGNQSFLDPEGETTALLLTVKQGEKKVKFQVHTLPAVESVEWDFGDGTTVTGSTSAIHVFQETGTYSVEAVVKFVDDIADETLTKSLALTIKAPPTNTAVPAITGTAQVGETLTATNGTWKGTPTPTYTIEWLADGEVLEGETSSTLVLTEDHLDKVISVRVTATNTQGTAAAESVETAAVIAA